jgi:WD40 repeat protein
MTARFVPCEFLWSDIMRTDRMRPWLVAACVLISGPPAASAHQLVLKHTIGPGPSYLDGPRSGKVAISPDGRHLATWSKYALERELQVWDAETGRLLQTLSPFLSGSGYFGREAQLAFSPDGKWLAVSHPDVWAGGDRPAWPAEVVLLDVKTGKSFPPFWKTADRFAFSPDGKVLAVGQLGHGPPTLYDLVGKKKVCTIEAGSGWHRLRFAPDGKTIASLDGAGRGLGLFDWRHSWVTLWDAGTGKKLATHKVAEPRVAEDVAWLADGTILVLTQEWTERPPERWHLSDAKTGKEKRPIPKDALDLALIDGKSLAIARPPSGGLGLRTEVVDLATGKTRTVAGRGLFSRNGARFVRFGDREPGISVWDVKTGKALCHLPGSGKVLGLAFSADGKVLFAAGMDNRVLLADVATGSVKTAWAFPRYLGEAVEAVAFNRDGSVAHLLTGGHRTLDLRTGKVKAVALGGRWGASVTLACAPDGKTLAVVRSKETRSGGGYVHENRITFHDAKSGKEVLRLPAGSGQSLGLAFSTDGKFLASGDVQSDKGRARHGVSVRETGTGNAAGPFIEVAPQQLSEGRHRDRHVTAFTPDGKSLAVAFKDGDKDGAIMLRDVASPKVVWKAPPKGTVYAMELTPNGELLVVVALRSGYPEVRLLNARTGAILKWVGPTPRWWSPTHLAIRRDGKMVATGHASGAIRLWEIVPPGKPGAERNPPRKEDRLPFLPGKGKKK